MELEIEEQFTARPYQDQLEEIAYQNNTIIHLPTGSGKTFIACHLITRFKEATMKPWNSGGKRTFFLVNNVPLVEQQLNVIKQMCPIKSVAGYSSEDRVDLWNKDTWDTQLSEHQVIVMTTQILQDMLQHQFIQIKDINLLILDECHHAVNDHPMRQVMKYFEDCPINEQPRVLGLTATLLNSNVNTLKLAETIKKLERTFHSTIATVNEMGEVLNYSTNPFEVIVNYSLTDLHIVGKMACTMLEELNIKVMQTILPISRNFDDLSLEYGQRDITVDHLKVNKKVKNNISDMICMINELGIYGGSLGIVACVIVFEQLKRKATNQEETLFFKYVITSSIQVQKMLQDYMANDHGYEKIVKYSSDKVLQLLNILKEYSPSMIDSKSAHFNVNRTRNNLAGIIFVKQRFTTKVLFNLLKAVKQTNPQEFGFLEHDFIVGYNVDPFKNTREQYYIKKKSRNALLKFANNDLNCLISTSVLEEGIDIPQCTLVIRYDVPLDYRAYIQSKGRARCATSSYVMLIKDIEFQQFSKMYQNFQYIEKYLQRLLVGCTDERQAPTDNEIKADLYEEDIIPPFINPNGGRLHSTGAISLINRYCSMLPHDLFTVITPRWIEETIQKSDGQYLVVTIIMPLACSIKKPIKGDPYLTLKNAKRSAALNSCIELYKAGELDPITMLPVKYAKVNYDSVDIKSCFLNWPWDSPDNYPNLPKPGTKKRIRKTAKVYPSCLKSSNNWSLGKQKLYLHVIRLQSAFEKPTASREQALYDLLNMPEGYALLTSHPLPKICDFPLFLTVGEVSASIEVNYEVISIDLQQFNAIKEFHYLVFNRVLEVAKKFLVFHGTVSTMYVVPVKPISEKYCINWDVINTYKTIQTFEAPTPEKRRRVKVTRDDFKYSVVSPWYRNVYDTNKYIVSEVLEHMTPQSPFDTDSYATYADYYRVKYLLELMGPSNQPLLEVRNISTRMNCLLPRAATLNTLSDKQLRLVSASQGDDKPKTFLEVFIPELCIKYDFPGVLWYKATMLPSIVHRVTMLLAAEELRTQIATEAGLGCLSLPTGEKWLPIKVNIHVATKSLLAQVESSSGPEPISRPTNSQDNVANPQPMKIVSMKESLYRLQMKKLSEEYPWDETKEPIDIERNIATVTLMDIECYSEFIAKNIYEKSSLSSPPRTIPNKPAILPPPINYNDKINLLSQKPTGRGPELCDVLAALTTINSHDTCDMEQVETLGDAFLKFVASLYLFHHFPKFNEGQLTNIKGRFIGNRNLFYAGKRIQLGGRLKVETFSPRADFILPGFSVPVELEKIIEEAKIRPTFLFGIEFTQEEILNGKISEESLERVRARLHDDASGVEMEPLDNVQVPMQCYIHAQAVRDKTIADSVEALIGTYLKSCGVIGAIRLLEWLRIMPQQDNFESYLKKSVPTPISLNKCNTSDVAFLLNHNIDEIQEIIGYKFRDPCFLLQALSHASYIRNRITSSYERFEFLGDAVLDMVITSYLFEKYPNLKPGQLTDLRSALVNNVTFASYVVKLGLHKYLCTQLNPALDSAIMKFVEHQEQRGHSILEDVLYLIDEEDCQIAQYIEVPKVLSDIFESLAGAIYLDSRGDLTVLWSVYYKIMYREIDTFAKNVPIQPVRLLYENIHACAKFAKPVVIDADCQKIMMSVSFTKNGYKHTVHGVGANKFQAKRAAAKLALKVLGT